MIWTVTIGLSEPLAPAGSLSSTRANSLITSPGTSPYCASGRLTVTGSCVGDGCGTAASVPSGRESLRLRNSCTRETP